MASALVIAASRTAWPKMRIVVSSGHAGNPTAGGGEPGRVGLAFQKVFLENDTRWRALLVGAGAEDTNVR